MKQPEISTPNGLLSVSARYKAPVFQRLYVWGKKEWDLLIDDIETADPDIGQFLGAIVLKDLGKEAGPQAPSRYLIIDGQQRLTTLYLLLLALAKTALEANENDSADFIWKNYLVEVKSKPYMGWPKVVPTLQDRHSFYLILEEALPNFEWDFRPDPEDTKPRNSPKLNAQWERINKYLSSGLTDKNGHFDKQLFDELLTKVQDYLRFINITLDVDDDANAIFNRLNAAGVPLELADLVRNEVFSKFGPGEGQKADRFYHKSWQPFEKSMPEHSLSGYFPIYAYIVFKGKVTKGAAFSALQKKWKKQTPQSVLSDLQRYSRYYISLSRFAPIGNLSKTLNGHVERLSRMPRATVTWPFIIEVLSATAEKALSEEQAVRSLKMVESFLVRRALVGMEPTGLHAVFKTLWDKTKGDPDQVLEKIVTRTIQSPDDKELLAYLKKERTDTRVILPFVLEEYEREYTKSRKYDPPPATAYTVEHVLPQHLTTDWGKIFSIAEHERNVGLLGNLAALSETQNKSLQDQAWAEKRKRFKGSNFKSTQAIAAYAEWNAKVIQKRTTDLASWAAGNWPRLSSI